MFIQILFLICLVCNTHGVASAASPSCGSDEYRAEQFCCLSCPGGYRVRRDCTATTNSSCSKCPNGHFKEGLSGQKQCSACTECVTGQKEKKSCTPTSDAECEIRDGFFCKESADKDTFSEATLSCQPHTICDSVGGVQIQPGTDSTDSTCLKYVAIAFIMIGCICFIISLVLGALFYRWLKMEWDLDEWKKKIDKMETQDQVDACGQSEKLIHKMETTELMLECFELMKQLEEKKKTQKQKRKYHELFDRYLEKYGTVELNLEIIGASINWFSTGPEASLNWFSTGPEASINWFSTGPEASINWFSTGPEATLRTSLSGEPSRVGGGGLEERFRGKWADSRIDQPGTLGEEQETPGDGPGRSRRPQGTAREGAGDPRGRPGKEQETPGDGPGRSRRPQGTARALDARQTTDMQSRSGGRLGDRKAVFHWRELEGWMSLDLQAVFHWRELEEWMSLDLQAVFHWRELEGWMSLDLQAVFHWRELEGWMSLDLQAVFHWRELEGWMSLNLQAVFHWRELEGWMSLDLQAVFKHTVHPYFPAICYTTALSPLSFYYI
ncbi:unnamed protein product [Gadus morhua 'NCC']